MVIKKYLLQLLTMFIFFSGSAQQQTPAWLFPIMFKDGNGEKDTVFLGYDPDTTYWKYFTIDTSKFKVSLSSAIYGDTALKIIVVSDTTFLYTYLGFNKGTMPLTMYWLDTLFYSDSLPYPNLSPKPRARGNLLCGDGDPNYFNCPTDAAIILTDMPDSLPFAPIPFTSSDSIVFNGDSTQQGISVGGFLLKILSFNSMDVGGGITETFSQNGFFLFPNPAEDMVSIQTYRQIRYSYTLLNVLGQIMATDYGVSPSVILNISDLPQGLYFVQLRGIDFTVTRKFIKK